MKSFLSIFVFAVFLFPSVTFASVLTTNQVNSIILLLEAFGVDAKTISSVKLALLPSSGSLAPTSSVPATPTNNTNAPTTTTTVVAAPSSIVEDLKFLQYPTFEKAGSQLRVEWRTNVQAMSWLLLCTQNPRQYGVISTDGCVAQTNNRDADIRVLNDASIIPTSGPGSMSDGLYFAGYVPAYSSPMFYVVEISANGQKLDYGGQIPQL